MAQLKDSLVTGSLRVTDTIFSTNINLSSATVSTAIVTDASKNLTSRTILNNTTATAVTGSDSLITANTLVNAGYVKSSGVTSITIKTTSPITGGSNTATTSTGTYTIAHDSGDGNKHVPANGTSNNGKFLKASGTAGSYSWSDLPTAATNAKGVVQIGDGLGVSSGTISVSYGTTAKTALQGNQTLFKLNNANKTAADAASFYAPTAGGTAGHILVAVGATSTPTWSANAYIIDESGSSVKNKRNELVLGNAIASGSNGSSFGRLALYSENTAGTYLISASGTAWKIATLPAATGMLAMIENSTAKGSDTKPVKVAATGLITECSDYAGGTAVTLNGTSAAASTASFYAPTASGTANHILVSSGANTAPSWKATAKGAVYATAANGALTFGTLGTAYGGTGNTSFTRYGVIYANPATKLVSTAAGTSGYLLQGNGSAAPSWIQATNANTASTIVKRDGTDGGFNAGTIVGTKLKEGNNHVVSVVTAKGFSTKAAIADYIAQQGASLEGRGDSRFVMIYLSSNLTTSMGGASLFSGWITRQQTYDASESLENIYDFIGFPATRNLITIAMPIRITVFANNSNAVTSYDIDMLCIQTITKTASASAWSTGTPSTQSISVARLCEDNTVMVGIANTATEEQYDACAQAKILCTTIARENITLTCYGTKPTVDIPIILTVMG